MWTGFEKNVRKLGIELSSEQIRQFSTYYDLLVSWNKKINLTAITALGDVLQKHFFDSLQMVLALNPNHQKVLDVGSGAGFPGIPLKIVFPGIRLTIVDALKKRIEFLRNLSETLNINVALIHDRIENHALKNHYDIVTARAVSHLRFLSELCLPFVREGGYFIAYKGDEIEEERADLQQTFDRLGGTLETIIPYTYGSYTRTLVKIKKCAVSDTRYPRPLHKIKKNPL